MLWSLIHNRNGVIKGEKIKRDKSRWIGCGRSPRLEANIWKWIDRMRREGTAINDLMIHRTSIVIAAQMGLVNFRPSPRWYSGFKKREAVVRERYSIYPNLDVKHQPELRVSQHTRCSASRAADADAESPQEHSTQETQRETATVCETKQIPDQGNPRVLVGPRPFISLMTRHRSSLFRVFIRVGAQQKRLNGAKAESKSCITVTVMNSPCVCAQTQQENQRQAYCDSVGLPVGSNQINTAMISLSISSSSSQCFPGEETPTGCRASDQDGRKGLGSLLAQKQEM
ncbi:hypothetical protein Baya_8139 [Bagarius yarrelli]|uniref:HTH CENPB-type domain-containing protein n=1 Tax=Bagarius yarrelli TaxID=175774 RepID=A0A556U5A6_BAGYA|nr:hypothetical protein Baya_8139 [Bagarius yarrelli]